MPSSNPIRDLFFLIWRYLNFPADTNAKITEVWQRMRALCEEFTIKSNHLQNEFQEKTDNFQRELEHLKSSLHAVQDRLGHVYNHLNSGLPWLPADQRLDQNPEFLLLAHLVSYFEEPIAFDVGANEG